MDKYSFYLLKFIHTLRANFDHVEAFVFSTRLQAAINQHAYKLSVSSGKRHLEVGQYTAAEKEYLTFIKKMKYDTEKVKELSNMIEVYELK